MYPQGVCRIRKSSSPTTAALYFKIQNRTVGTKDPLRGGKAFQEYPQLKRERGECFIHPAVAPVSRMSVFSTLWCYPRVCSLGGQNLAALCTAAGQNLAAVGSSHSLTETVDLGTMTAAGLVGTLHNTFTSCLLVIYARQPGFRPQQHTVSGHTEPH